ncbi:hypothetical protein [Pseudomonas shahriarae]|uniref:hypothetical protein n=1 Tax=Pseudomonas shahriarae TaxID=2745512 RepID=UPI002361C25C|nr:hypothetical protein [Pseudomonas shahriarae]MDD0981712.1 hypothetical protein [Pseudomonas shahriarae]
MANSVGVDGYIHIEGFEKFEREAFDKKKIRAAMRKAGKLVRQRAQMNIALARGQDSYPVNRTGELLGSINFKVSRSGFMVKVAPYMTSSMGEYYPAYLHYGVRLGSRIKKLAPGEGRGKSNRRRSGARAALVSKRKSNGWRIEPRANYMSDALQDSSSDVRAILSRAFADALM